MVVGLFTPKAAARKRPLNWPRPFYWPAKAFSGAALSVKRTQGQLEAQTGPSKKRHPWEKRVPFFWYPPR
jgi:hypothetical protein